VSDPKVWHFSFHAQRDLAEALIQGREYLYVSRFIRDRAFNPAAVGEAEIMKGIDQARMYWAGGFDGNGFLHTLPAKAVAGIARAAGNIVDTRRDRLFALAERLEH